MPDTGLLTCAVLMPGDKSLDALHPQTFLGNMSRRTAARLHMSVRALVHGQSF